MAGAVPQPSDAVPQPGAGLSSTVDGPPTPESGLTGQTITLRVFKGQPGGEMGYATHEVPEVTQMVVLDAVHWVQRNQDSDLACRWNCKAGKCGSCSAEVNGRPVLMCKTRIDTLPRGPVTVQPMKSFPLIKDLVTDVSHNYETNKLIPPFTAAPDDGTPWRIQQMDIDRLYEYRRCIECFLCQDVCHVLREHGKYDQFIGPRFLVYAAALEMHPLDTGNRVKDLKEKHGIGYCNITTCCRQVCPESITITENAIIPLKERVVDRYFDPLKKLLHIL